MDLQETIERANSETTIVVDAGKTGRAAQVLTSHHLNLRFYARA